MTNTDLVLENREGEVITLLVNRPQALNSLNKEVLLTLKEKLLGIDSSVRLILLRGAGGKAFVAGADIRWMKEASTAELSQFIDLGQEVMRLIENRPQPVIAIVEGFALGGGLELALACDCILATDKAKLGLPEVGLGLIPGFGGTQRLIRRVGVGMAKRLTFTGEILGSEEGYRSGLVDWLVAASELETKIVDIGSSVIKKGPLALKQAKRLIDRADDGGRFSALRDERDTFVQLSNSLDAKEGMTAFLEKRGSNFTGK